jgi:hypothetical protein
MLHCNWISPGKMNDVPRAEGNTRLEKLARIT